MIDCPKGEIRDQLPDFVHDQLSPSARADVAEHVADCAACAVELALLRELRGTLRAAPAVNVARIVAALPAPPRSAGRGWMTGTRSRLADWRIAAAVAALIVGGGSAAVLGGGRRRADADRERVAQQTPATAIAGSSREQVQQVATNGLSIDADLTEASVIELEALLDDLESFDGLPSSEPEAPVTPGVGEEGL